MMPASNAGLGMNIGFPDVCLTPPMGAPIPYPNLALNAMAAVRSPNIFVGYMQQLNMASVVPLTNGDQAGIMHPLYMQMGGQTLGNPRVLINCIPAKHLCVPTFGNLFNNPIGLCAVPSITTTMYSDAELAHTVTLSEPRLPAAPPLDANQARALRDAVRGSALAVTSEQLADGVGLVAIHRVTSDAATRFFNALRKLDVSRGLVLDLRDNPGGDLDVALELASEIVPQGAVLAHVDPGDGPVARTSRLAPSYCGRLVVLVNGATASAAEAIAACVRAHRRGVLLGEKTYGKGSAQSAVRGPRGELTYRTTAGILAPDGSSYDGCGIMPDEVCTNSSIEARAVEIVMTEQAT